MGARATGIALILFAVLVLTGSQLMIKSVLQSRGSVPFGPFDFGLYALSLVRDPEAWIGALGLVIAATLWYTALSRLPLSVAFPFGALSYPLIFFGSVFVLREQFSWTALAGNALIVGGVLLVAASAAGR